MKAAYLKAPFRVEMRDIPEPSLGAGEVMLKPKLVGICGTDIQLARQLAEDWMRFGHEPVAEVGLESRVAVLGPGPIGLMAIRVARARGARRIYVLGTTADAERFPLCRELGADECIDVTRTDALEAILSLTDGRGVDSVMNS